MTEPRYRLTEEFLGKCLDAKKDELKSSVELAAFFISISQAYGLIMRATLEAREQDAHALALRGKRVGAREIAIRMQSTERAVYLWVERNQRARREALKLAV